MKLRATLSLLLGMTVCTVSHAANWYLTGTKAGFAFYVNLDEIQCQGTLCTTWQAHITTDTSEEYDVFMSRTQFDCKQKKHADLARITYKNAKLIQSLTAPYIKWSYAVPDSQGAAIMDCVCNPKKRDPQYIRNYKFLPKQSRQILKDLRAGFIP